MKIKITRPDGTVIEAEGTAEECAALAGLAYASVAITMLPCAPTYVPMPYPVSPSPAVVQWAPTWIGDTSGRFQ